MERKIYIICQKINWASGKPQVLSDGNGRLSWVFASLEWLKRAKMKVIELNKDKTKNPVHIRKCEIKIGKLLKWKKKNYLNKEII